MAIAALVALAHLVAAIAGSGYWFDEVYMLAIGRAHLDWGSADQPPLAPAVAAFMDAVAPGSVVALRLPVILMTATAVVVAALIAREMGCDSRAQGLAAGAQATGAWAALTGHWLTPYTVEPLQWLLLTWLLVRWIRIRDDRLLVILGVVAGIAAMTKFQVLLLCPVLLLTVALLGPRELLRRPLLWVGIGAGALIALPTLLWQQFHGWPQLKMARVVAGEAVALYGGRPSIAVQFVLFAGVAGAMLVGYGLWQLFRSAELREYRCIALSFVVLYIIFVAADARPYYLAGLYAPLVAAGALGLQRRRETGSGRYRWLIWPTYAVSAALAVGLVTLSVSITRSDVGQRIARGTATAYHALPSEERQRTAVLGESYIVAAYLDGLGAVYQLPGVHSTNRSYGYFPPPPEDHDAVLYVGSGPDELRPHFRSVRKVGDITEDLGVWLLTGRIESWRSLWPRLRTLTVG